MKDKPIPGKDYGLPAFVDGPAMTRSSWTTQKESAVTDEIHLCARQIAKLKEEGLDGIDLVGCLFSRRIQPL